MVSNTPGGFNVLLNDMEYHPSYRKRAPPVWPCSKNAPHMTGSSSVNCWTTASPYSKARPTRVYRMKK